MHKYRVIQSFDPGKDMQQLYELDIALIMQQLTLNSNSTGLVQLYADAAFICEEISLSGHALMHLVSNSHVVFGSSRGWATSILYS
jgi:hypothetical protein